MGDSFRIRDFAETDSVPTITAMLHAAYGPLAASGLRFVATHQDDAMTLRRLRNGIPFVAESGSEIIGTITLYRPSADSVCE